MRSPGAEATPDNFAFYARPLEVGRTTLRPRCFVNSGPRVLIPPSAPNSNFGEYHRGPRHISLVRVRIPDPLGSLKPPGGYSCKTARTAVHSRCSRERGAQLARSAAPISRTVGTIRSTSSGRVRQLTIAGRNATLPS